MARHHSDGADVGAALGGRDGETDAVAMPGVARGIFDRLRRRDASALVLGRDTSLDDLGDD
jgi:hypothetical protein